ncbi:sigma-70 family RNA polymerase sigma factor [Nonomuraea aurantiaca]|uniref:sigma-70 family RNA polymerase sigma factor n=1 Tax=Nonomuraea aurantiaca TaxID=2878562 RepID=UPI001CD993BF|nr:sigma-70 family RNA polymerase sigma factor [Nonomuraea aurantiaca]MCA2227677.1 sigma-70 family RNA polymerase sigma factor [Nonomuraea aurantiaca]
MRAGDATAYRELHDRHVAAARSLARQLVRGEAEADDVVAESFTKILDLVGRGGGPSAGFRTYLLTVVRRTVYDRTRVADGRLTMGRTEPQATPDEPEPQATLGGSEGLVIPGGSESLDPGVPFIDPALIGLERSLIAKAFLSLPERWRAVLWHTEVEHLPPADVAPLLGLSANGVTDLARRALAGLRQAYLQTHLAAPPPHTCRLALGRMSRYVRGVLARRDVKAVDEHASGCPECRAVLLELTDVSRGLRVIIGPLITGSVFAGYAAALAEERSPSAAPEGLPRALGRLGQVPGRLLERVRQASGQASGRLSGEASGRVWRVPAYVLGRVRRLPKHVLGWARRVPRHVFGWVGRVPTYAQAAVAGGTAAAVAAAAAFTLVSAEEPMPRPVAKPVASAGPSPVRPADEPTRVPPGRPTTQSATRGHRARLHATIGVLGALVRDQPGIIGLRLRNSGNAPTAELTATVALPAGVTLIPSGNHRHGGAAGVTLTRPHGSDHGAAPIQRGSYSHGAVTDGMSIRSGGYGHSVEAGRVSSQPGGYGHGVAVATPVGTVDGWACRPAGQGAVCARGPLEARRRTAVFLRVQVAAQAPQGDGPAVRIAAGSLRVGARSTTGVRREGMPARFATDGRVTVRAVGNSLLSCPLERDGCAEARRREGDRRDDELWPMAVVDQDGAPETYASSGAALRLPPGGRVVWAGLYWSASGENAGPIRLRPPGRRRYLFIRPEQVAVRDLPSGPAYQAFADVTGLVGSVRQEGTWWAADPPMGEGVAQHAGWSLVVIATDPTQPYSHAVVLDTPTVIGGEAGQTRIPLDGLVPPPAPAPARSQRNGGASAAVPARSLRRDVAPAAVRARVPGRGQVSGGASRRVPPRGKVPARIEMVAWGGDADLDGDRLSLGSGPLTPMGGDRDADNVFDGSSNGAKGMTFGVDVDTFGTQLGHDPALAIDTRKDVVLFAIAAVSVRARS